VWFTRHMLRDETLLLLSLVSIAVGAVVAVAGARDVFAQLGVLGRIAAGALVVFAFWWSIQQHSGHLHGGFLVMAAVVVGLYSTQMVLAQRGKGASENQQ